MRIDVVTIFPAALDALLGIGVIGRARAAGSIDLRLLDPRDATTDVHRSVDDTPFGGGAGMVMGCAPLFSTVEREASPRPVLLLGPAGERFDQAVARRMADLDGFTLICGRYEGVDDRVRAGLCDGELSVGDVVLAGGEAAAAVVVEAVGRLLPGVLGNEASTTEESFAGAAGGLLEYPQYTRPATFRGMDVPEVLRSGDHGRIARWRLAQSLARTLERRPDLIAARGGLRGEERAVLEEFGLADAGRGEVGPDGDGPAQVPDA